MNRKRLEELRRQTEAIQDELLERVDKLEQLRETIEWVQSGQGEDGSFMTAVLEIRRKVDKLKDLQDFLPKDNTPLSDDWADKFRQIEALLEPPNNKKQMKSITVKRVTNLSNNTQIKLPGSPLRNHKRLGSFAEELQSPVHISKPLVKGTPKSVSRIALNVTSERRMSQYRNARLNTVK